jgi:class 3 adenylate cyclase
MKHMRKRLAAILLTDLSGYTEFISSADAASIEVAIQQQQDIVSPVLQQFHGRLIKWIGDSALATFDSAVDAILCGHQIQRRFVDLAERGSRALVPRVKAVVHVGETLIDADGDIYGDAVNLTARMEKIATADEVYLSEVVRSIVPRAEVPTELAGTYEFKGIGDQIPVYRTCFGTSPVVRERLVLVHINFVGVQRLADEFGWDTVHPRLDEITARIIASTREAGGTNRGVGETGCLLSFPSVGSALGAYTHWATAAAETKAPPARCFSVGVRCAIHWGTLNVMRFTVMGRDIEVVRTLAALGTEQQILLTAAAVDCARAEG